MTTGKTMTTLATVTEENSAEKELTLPSENVSSALEIKGEETPIMAVGGLDELAQEIADSSSAEGAVTVTMTVQHETEATASHAQEIQTAAGDQQLEYL